MTIFLKVLFCLLAYLFGSIPFGLIISKIKKTDLREKGSHNIGAANAGRVLGKKYAILTFIFDMIKGALFVVLFRYNIIPSKYMVLSPSLYGLLACIGHCFPVFLKFKGGKAVATGAGCLFAYFPQMALISILAFVIIVKITKISALGSLISGLLLTIITIVYAIISYDSLLKMDVDFYVGISAVLIYTLILIKHIPNIKRMITKTENTVSKIQ